ncbi:MAG: C4-type zinc ribbon domain-containing protein [Thermodesulfobacteriota bacterium]|jgi:predicted  nucleic acid-binding Zn-ribbon protein|nr:C4-type zinc ribbon domain-containing protein [Thermodesulfobacteriota bacterium]
MEGSDVQQQLKVLRDLQRIDTHSYEARQQRQELENELAELEREGEQVRALVTELGDALEALENERHELARELEQERENVVKAEERLPAIKTQKEYVAVLKEVDTAKKNVRDLEQRIAGKNDEIDRLGQEKLEKDEELAAQEEKVSERKGDIDEQLRQIDTALSSREDERKALFDRLPRMLGKRYQMLVDRRGGLAVVEARGGACLGCNMQLPPQSFNELFRNDEVMTCPHCNRIIYLDPETPGQA